MPNELKIVAKAESLSDRKLPNLTDEISRAMKNKERIYCKILLKNERFWLIPIKEDKDGFIGVVDNQPLSDINFNDLIEFKGCDVFQVLDHML